MSSSVDSLLPSAVVKAAMNCISVLDRVDRAYLRGSPIALAALGATSAYYVAYSYGAGVIFLLLGREKAARIFGNAANHPVLILVGIPLIPVLLVSLESCDIEGRILIFWRRTISPRIKTVPIVGSAVEWIWSSPSRVPHLSTLDGLSGTIDYLARNISSGLVLPFIAYALGVICFQRISQSHTKRVLLGGLTFFSMKTLAKVYLRQQEYRRQGSRTVLNYSHSPQPQDQE